MENFNPDSPHINHVNIAPVTISNNLDQREFQEVSPEEQKFITSTLFTLLSFDPANPTLAASYTIEKPDRMKMQSYTDEAWSGVANVSVYETARSGENMYLHFIKYPDGRIEYAVAPKDRRL